MATVIVRLPCGRGAPMSPTRPVEQAATDAGESVESLLEAFFASHQPSAWLGDSHPGSPAQSAWYTSHPGYMSMGELPGPRHLIPPTYPASLHVYPPEPALHQPSPSHHYAPDRSQAVLPVPPTEGVHSSAQVSPPPLPVTSEIDNRLIFGENFAGSFFAANPRMQSGNAIRTIVQPQYVLDLLITELFAGVRGTWVHLPVLLKPEYMTNPDLITMEALGYRVQAKELRLQDAQRERKLLFTFSVKPDFVAPPKPLPHAPGQGAEQSYVGVWELLPTSDARSSKLFLRGYFDYSAQEFSDLDEHPQATGLQYWLSVKQATSQHSSQPVLKVNLERLDVLSSQALLPIQPQDAQTPIVDFGARLNLGRSFDGRPTSLYQEILETHSILDELKTRAHLGTRAFGQVQMTEVQKRQITAVISHKFHLPVPVKILRRERDEFTMLIFHPELNWVTNHVADVVSVWKVTAGQGRMRDLFNTGFYHLTPEMWGKLTEDRIPGLYDAKFRWSIAARDSNKRPRIRMSIPPNV
ncbi:uncharacterized protein PAN0_004d2170 [Moesziomyces antarcticus]|uniref:Uncharacterized protein n=2 Tax=Pseudozyma antarctica TaxID=84753 RepID=A0A081CBB5_PSEA2|nr:uncharacterized protein PAN0_004d2170 [Moesziomyces antarcticus]GAK63961.1 hypothetical protein PAN0_004d2170 [Moesziomyces antarcticus]